MKAHCCIDLELEQPMTNSQTPDSLLTEESIIQVGYVIYSLEPEFTIHKQVCEHIDIGVPLSSFIKKLTGITNDDIKAGKNLTDVYNSLVKDIKDFNCVRSVKQWGGGDIECLKKELPYVKWELGRSGFNIKHLYQMYAEKKRYKPFRRFG